MRHPMLQVLCAGLSLLGLGLLLWGWPRGAKYVRPDRFRTGLVLASVGLTCIWLFPAAVFLLLGPSGTELQGLLALIALALGAGIFGGGIDLMRRANTKPEGDYWDSV